MDYTCIIDIKLHRYMCLWFLLNMLAFSFFGSSFLFFHFSLSLIIMFIFLLFDSLWLLQVHGNVSLASVVVTQTLDWKLHAFDVLSEFDSNNEASTVPVLVIFMFGCNPLVAICSWLKQWYILYFFWEIKTKFMHGNDYKIIIKKQKF